MRHYNRPMEFVRAAALHEIPPGGRLAVKLAGRDIALFNIDGAIFAIEDRCPHAFAPLNDGELCGTRLSCVWHGWTFELDPARATKMPPDVTRFPVKIEAGAVYVGEPDESTRRASSPGCSIQ
jgi:nitrite reductase/ring-hydroxylating ferredoxin subunit